MDILYEQNAETEDPTQNVKGHGERVKQGKRGREDKNWRRWGEEGEIKGEGSQRENGAIEGR